MIQLEFVATQQATLIASLVSLQQQEKNLSFAVRVCDSLKEHSCVLCVSTHASDATGVVVADVAG